MRRKPSPRSKLTPPIGERTFRRARGETRRDAIVRDFTGRGWTLIAVYDQELPKTTLYSLIFEYGG
ncbi:hypothetical protein [Exiguobacterium sp. BMC-KP]|uniref:hypothetical protein n=1 Tax=Exiguobacterium sp. BMC-KP TaxID=1684312 RepID=UPI00128E1F52|nr:hypothetical protein [Exiguobacterium sp. BMC-KP]